MLRLAIVSTHPIQYNAPLFRLLTEEGKVSTKVFYTWSQTETGSKYDPGFGKEIEWDIPLLQGYDYRFVENTSDEPGTHHFKGIVNPSLIADLSSWKPSAILIFGWSFKSHLACIRHFHNKVPVIFRGDSTLLDETSKIKAVLRHVFLKWVYSYIDTALYTGLNNKEYFLKCGVRHHKLLYAPHAVDNQRFAGLAELYQTEAEEVRKSMQIAADDLVVLFAGKLEQKKNPFFILELAKLIPSERLKFLLVGNGSLEHELKVKASGDTRVIFMDFCNQSRMPAIYRTGDILILPSKGPGETWGLAANEAMACGLPVMLSNKVGGAVDLVDEPGNGIVFGINEYEKCVNLLNSLLDNRQQLLAMKQNALKKIQEFSYQHVIKAIYQSMNISEPKSAITGNN